MNQKIDRFIVGQDRTIKEAMARIEKGGSKIALVVDNEKKLLGVVTDGDIRRALLVEENFNKPIKEIMTRKPITAQEDTPATELLEIMLREVIQEIPIIDNNGLLKDIVFLPELKNIPLSSPDITQKEVRVINQVLSTPFLSIGPKVKEFEQKMADYIGRKYAIAVNSGTSGLHLCIRSLGIKDGDEVITTPFSFIASANCILFERAKPVFVDIDENTLCIDADKIEEKITSKTKAILPVHIFGNSCDMDRIMEIARRHRLAVIEDACEAPGAEYKGKKVGSFGGMAVFAFYPNKQLTTGEGGLIVTDKENLAKLCQSMRNQGRDESQGEWLVHERLGYNYRMSELNAALGSAQMDRIDEILKKRQKVADEYNKRLGKTEGIKTLYAEPGVKMSWFVYIIILDENRFSQEDRNQIMEKLREKGISCRNYFPPIHLQPFYREKFNYKKGDFPITEKVSDLTIALPFYNNLTAGEIDYICDNLNRLIKCI